MPKRRAATRPPPHASAAALRDRIARLANNLWWSWNSYAQRLFESLDPRQWEATNRNPLLTLRRVPDERLTDLGRDSDFLDRLSACETALARYLDTRPWYARVAKPVDRRLCVAYFCSEYAVHECLPQYAGGLGVLAGDHLKSASDLGIPLVAVGLLYRSGYYQHSFAADGATRVHYPRLIFEDLPLEDTGKHVDVPVARRRVRCRIWRAIVGRTPLCLLDSDVAANSPADRRITDQLYGGDSDHRVEQQVLLGVGGCLALDALGVRPSVYHLNEGHAAFVCLERLRRLRTLGRSLETATAAVRSSTVFTTHTPVAAGHDRYLPAQITRHLAATIAGIGSPATVLGLGRERVADRKEPFCMTVLALKLSSHCNGVARLHGDTSRRMWAGLYEARDPDDVPIGHVTNGVHPQSWLAPEIEPLYARYLKPRWVGAGPRDDWWRHAEQIPPQALWDARCVLRANLVNFIRRRLAEQIAARGGPVDDLAAAHRALREDALTIGFARRFATYKRAPLIFRDARRLAKIVGDAKRPVQLVFAGKAHPRDLGGQEYAQRVYEAARQNGFRGRVVVLENYDMHVGRMLTAGCDVWLNNPIRPMEASGTSGMKPPLHGGLNCSILDGWWPEAFNRRNGWAIGDGRSLKSPAAQDAYDAKCIYELLEGEIVPLFYRRDGNGVPAGWVRLMIESMKTVCARFSSHRMLADYLEKYYLPAHRG